jgi:hypothetical protein
MWCKAVKWITLVVTVNIQINRDQIQNPQLITVAEILTRDNIFSRKTAEECLGNLRDGKCSSLPGEILCIKLPHPPSPSIFSLYSLSNWVFSWVISTDERSNFSPSFIYFPLLIIIPPLLHTQISPPLEMCNSLDHATHYHILCTPPLTRHLAVYRVRELSILQALIGTRESKWTPIHVASNQRRQFTCTRLFTLGCC